MKKNLFVLTVITAVGFFGCNYDNYQNAHPSPKVSNGVCDSSHVMSFATDITPIFQASCLIGCHSSASASGAVILDTYIGASKQARNGQLVVSVKHSGPNTTPTTWMPMSGSISACDIAKITKWVNSGYPNN
jgi:hypothetical protein